MDLLDYLLQHLSVDKLVTAMKDRGFVLASTNPHQSSPHFPPEQAHFHHPSSPPHHLPPPVQTLPPKTATASMQLPLGRERHQPPPQHGADRAREREGERKRRRAGQTATAPPPSQASAGPTARTHAGPTNAPLPLPSQVTGPPSLPPFPATTGQGGAKKRIKAILH
jgi:hypothetical protein